MVSKVDPVMISEKLVKAVEGSTAAPAAGSTAPVIASKLEAEDGTDNTKMMTPLRVKQAIEKKFIDSGLATQLTDAFPVGSYLSAQYSGDTPALNSTLSLKTSPQRIGAVFTYDAYSDVSPVPGVWRARGRILNSSGSSCVLAQRVS